jgi:uncharacterized membrane protein
MDWLQVLVIVFGNAAWVLPVFFWVRSESNADRRDIVNLIVEIKNEMRDFHGRMCAIEENKKREK